MEKKPKWVVEELTITRTGYTDHIYFVTDEVGSYAPYGNTHTDLASAKQQCDLLNNREIVKTERKVVYPWWA